MRSSRKTLLESLRPDLTILTILGVVAALWALSATPLQIGRGDEASVGSTPPSVSHSCDTLLLLPDPPTQDAPTTFSTLDMSSGWYNILDQEVGCFKHLPTSKLSATSWTSTRLVVVSSAAARNMRSDYIDSLGRWVEQGGLLLVEQPDPRWNSTTGIPVSAAQPRITRRITGADGSPLRGALRDRLMDSPLTTTMIIAELGIDGKGRSPHDILMEVDGRPAFIHRERGSGHAYVLTIDAARAITTLQQGRPLDDFSLPPSEADGVPETMTQPWVMVTDKKMLDNDVPFADLLERHIMESTAMHEPLPRFWYYPDTFAGAFIMSHNEAAFGDKALYITDWEHAHGHATTNFITPDAMGTTSLRQMREQGHDVQVQWNRGFDGELQTRSYGLGPLRPVALEMTLDEQRQAIEEPLEGWSVTLSRVHGLTWDQDWASTFQKMAAARIAADSSYGPTGPKQFGYLFGTGRSFYPIDHQGRLLPIKEIPFVMQDGEHLDMIRLRRLVVNSERGHHQVVMPVFHANTMAERPRADVMNTWRTAFEHAERHQHWVTTLRDLLLFEEARRASSIRSRFIRTERRLEINVETTPPRIDPRTPPPGKKPRPAPAVSLAIPQKYDGDGVESVSIDGKSVPLRKLGRSGDGFYHVMRVPPGKHNIYVIYGGRVIEAITPED